ncbi:MAG TPA: hypothetical protein PLP29_12895 [Candidatus Ozemobacteraceae bacterium]|nr:hypothetical protein [Candidatus Ozemobacteraceae bacterium]
MILDKLPPTLAGILPPGTGSQDILVYESTSAFDGTTGTSWLIVSPPAVFVFSAPPLGTPEPVTNFLVRGVQSLTASKSILGDIHLAFSLRSEEKPFVFSIPSLLQHEWHDLSGRLAGIFGDTFTPEVTDTSFGSGSLIDSTSGITLAAIPGIDFKPISGVTIDTSKMASSLDTTMSDLGDQITVQVTDESGSTPSTLADLSAGLSLPAREPVKPQSKQAVEAAEQKKKKFHKSRPNLLQEPPRDADGVSSVVCPACSRKNLPDYTYCLGCGQELESAKRKQQRKTGKPQDYGYSSSSGGQEEEASGCLTQLFYFIIGVGALLFFISIGK